MKKGVSAVIATVLIIMITVAAIAIIWVAIIPTIRQSFSSNSCSLADVSINGLNGYTGYDATNNIVIVQVTKGSENITITSLKFYLNYEGNSYYYTQATSMGPRDVKTFYLNTSGIGGVEKVKVVPIITEGVSSVECLPATYSPLTAIDASDFESQTVLQQDGGETSPADSNITLLRVGLVGYWPLDSDVYDYSPLRLNNGTNGDSVATTGKVNGGYLFNNSYIDLDTDASIPSGIGTGNFTFAVWLYALDQGSGSYVIEQHPTSGHPWTGIYLDFHPAEMRFRTTTTSHNAGLYYDSSAIIEDGNWHHVAIQRDAGDFKLYFDGSLVSSDNYNQSDDLAASYGGTPLRLGAHCQGGGSYFNGSLDEAAIWNRTLNSTEISWLYNSGSGLSLIE